MLRDCLRLWLYVLGLLLLVLIRIFLTDCEGVSNSIQLELLLLDNVRRFKPSLDCFYSFLGLSHPERVEGGNLGLPDLLAFPGFTLLLQLGLLLLGGLFILGFFLLG